MSDEEIATLKDILQAVAQMRKYQGDAANPNGDKPMARVKAAELEARKLELSVDMRLSELGIRVY